MVVALQQQLDWPSTWEEAEVFARRLTDGLEYPIDADILETVVALILLGFQTNQSCEGHLDGGRPYPWIAFETGECPAWYEQAQEETCCEGLSAQEEEAARDRLFALLEAYHQEDHLYTRLTALLDGFYEASETPNSDDWRLIVHCLFPGSYRMCSAYGYAADEWPEKVRAAHLARAQAEVKFLASSLAAHLYLAPLRKIPKRLSWVSLCEKLTLHWKKRAILGILSYRKPMYFSF